MTTHPDTIFSFDGREFVAIDRTPDHPLAFMWREEEMEVESTYAENGFFKGDVFDLSWSDYVDVFVNRESATYIFFLSPMREFAYEVVCQGHHRALRFWATYLAPLMSSLAEGSTPIARLTQ
jgi:hypothetical protein